MAKNYATPLPQDREMVPMQYVSAPVPALQTNASDNNTVSSVISFNDNATTIEVAAIGSGAAIKWIAVGNTNPSVISAAGSANFDNIIAPNTVKKFVIPREKQAVPSIVGLNVQEGLYRRVAVKSLGASSVLTTQY